MDLRNESLHHPFMCPSPTSMRTRSNPLPHSYKLERTKGVNLKDWTFTLKRLNSVKEANF